MSLVWQLHLRLHTVLESAIPDFSSCSFVIQGINLRSAVLGLSAGWQAPYIPDRFTCSSINRAILLSRFVSPPTSCEMRATFNRRYRMSMSG